jgi:hypothetical protein
MIYLAVVTGRLAKEAIGAGPTYQGLLAQHQASAEMTRQVFSLLTVVFVGLLIVRNLLERNLDSWVVPALLIAFLVLYGSGAVSLVDTARMGSSLVQRLGTTSTVTRNLPLPGGR